MFKFKFKFEPCPRPVWFGHAHRGPNVIRQGHWVRGEKARQVERKEGSRVVRITALVEIGDFYLIIYLVQILDGLSEV